MNLLSKPLSEIKGIGIERAKILSAYLDLKTLGDLIYYLPLRHVDRTKTYTTLEARHAVGEEIQLEGKISHFEEIAYGKNQKRLQARFTDSHGMMSLVWFSYTPQMLSYYKSLDSVIIFGTVNEYNDFFSIPHPEIEKPGENAVAKTLIPIYPTSEKLTKRGISQRFFRTVIRTVFTDFPMLEEEFLPPYLLQKYGLPTKNQALHAIHFPAHFNEKNLGIKRMKLEEALLFLVTQHLRKTRQEQNSKGLVMANADALVRDFYQDHLPFQLTGAQKRVIREIRRDLKSGKQMNRLLQGDVGSGKTMVALFSMLIAADNGFQSCLMAPTEILAQQHYRGLSSLLQEFPVRIELLTGSTPKSKRKSIHADLIQGNIHILIGTHALLEEPVQFQNLGLAVIDEQHRFGVAQRSRLWTKNHLPPHILLMTATPIPRTLAMTFYADLEVSVIDELPQGRKPIITAHRKDADRYEVNRFIRDQLIAGRQAYFVFPLIEESEVLNYKNATQAYDDISSDFPDFRVALLHGAMKNDEKDRAMDLFKKGEAQILVSTTVIEVGVDVPNASVMVIENADRFGLAQLHQLRGRVGRGAEQSYCILMTEDKLSKDGRTRIKTMCATQDGFKISEVDMKLRGAGDLLGTKQSGAIDFKFLDLKEDAGVIKFCVDLLQKIIAKDPLLNHPENQALKNAALLDLKTSKKWANIA